MAVQHGCNPADLARCCHDSAFAARAKTGPGHTRASAVCMLARRAVPPERQGGSEVRVHPEARAAAGGNEALATGHRKDTRGGVADVQLPLDGTTDAVVQREVRRVLANRKDVAAAAKVPWVREAALCPGVREAKVVRVSLTKIRQG